MKETEKEGRVRIRGNPGSYGELGKVNNTSYYLLSQI